MPVTQSAKKALRKQKKRTLANKIKLKVLKGEIKKFKKQKDPKLLEKIYSLVDKLVKTHVFHKNKGSRIKSRLTLLLNKEKEKTGKNKKG